MMKYSATFGGTDLRATYGIIVEKFIDAVLPPLRAQKIIVPGRSGTYDFGSSEYDERTIELQCASVSLTREQVRELAYLLRQKGRLSGWEEPGKYYVGRVEDSAGIEKILSSGRRFTLPFVCGPFAYSAAATVETFTNDHSVTCNSTAKTPARIEITNTGAAALTGIQITVFRRA